MSKTVFLIIFLVGSISLTKQITGLVASIKSKDSGKVKAQILILSLTIFVITGLLLFEKFDKR